jgi:ribosomal protein S18 acetylase RimI-like enzyme
MKIEISTAGADQVDALAPLWIEMVEHHRDVVGRQWPVRSAPDAWVRRREEYRRWLAEASGLLFVARDHGATDPVGYAFCRLIESGPTFDLGPVRGEVDSLVVADTARGAGVGTALLRVCREELLRRGITYWSIGVVEANSGAVQLYERLGFHPWIRSMLGRTDDPV